MALSRPCNLLVLLGPTASGKTSLAVRLARHLRSETDRDVEIISADSRQVYRGMDLGTGKDRHVFLTGGAPVQCHLIDIANPGEEYNLYRYQKAFYRTFREILERGSLPILVGGSGLYIEAVTKQYDLPPALDREGGEQRLKELRTLDRETLRGKYRTLVPDPHNTTDMLDRERLARALLIEESRRTRRLATEEPPALNPFMIGVRIERALLRRLIRSRLLDRINAGMIDEVRRLNDAGVSWERLDAIGLEYRYIGRHLQGFLSREELVETLAVRIGQFAKRQETWFRRMERRGAVIHWIGYDDFPSLRRLTDTLVARGEIFSPCGLGTEQSCEGERTGRGGDRW